MPTETAVVQPTTAPKRKRNALSGQFSSTKVEVSKKHVTIRLPVNVARTLELADGKNVYWLIINGVVQISAHVPNVSIPTLNVANSGFIPQS